MSLKKILAEKDAEARRILEKEILPEINRIPAGAVKRVTSFLKGKLDVYQQSLTPPVNGNGKLTT